MAFLQKVKNVNSTAINQNFECYAISDRGIIVSAMFYKSLIVNENVEKVLL